jgi:hypothetical protein
LTSYIEGLNNILRQRISRLVRNPLPCSQKLENYIGVIWMFIHQYNRLESSIKNIHLALTPSVLLSQT